MKQCVTGFDSRTHISVVFHVKLIKKKSKHVISTSRTRKHNDNYKNRTNSTKQKQKPKTSNSATNSKIKMNVQEKGNVLGLSNMKVTVSLPSSALMVMMSSLPAHLSILAMLLRFMPMEVLRSQR